MSQDNQKIRFGLWYDFRNPSQWHQPPDELYAATLDQIAWGDNHGFELPPRWAQTLELFASKVIPAFR